MDDGEYREVADRIVEISDGIRLLSVGRGGAATLPAIGAAVRGILHLTGATAALVLAADDVIAACEEITPEQTHPTVVSLPAVVEAETALCRLKDMAFGSPI